jgi:hypothetical protein
MTVFGGETEDPKRQENRAFLRVVLSWFVSSLTHLAERHRHLQYSLALP